MNKNFREYLEFVLKFVLAVIILTAYMK